MSNQVVGAVYQKIIDEVISQCRAPFEEEGAQANVLDDFKKAWQQNISERKVATMPWDPTPPPSSAAPNPVPQPRPQQTTQQPAQQYPASAQTAHQNADVKIKTEPGATGLTDLSNLPGAVPYSQHNPGLAYQNATQNLREQFGDKADASIRQINDRAQEVPHGQKRPLPAGSPTQETFDNKKRMTDYSGGMRAQAQANMAQLSSAQVRPSTIGAAQTDGAADWSALVAERRALAALGSENADLSIANRVKQLQRAEEGGGLLMPVSEQVRQPPLKLLGNPRVWNGPGPCRFDGGEDAGDDDDDAKDDLDADAINSDLDDEEDDIIDEDDEDTKAGEIMVCTYEKVARVKNKWKCTLRDGILITGGREYVFGKATGEFEW